MTTLPATIELPSDIFRAVVLRAAWGDTRSADGTIEMLCKMAAEAGRESVEGRQIITAARVIFGTVENGNRRGVDWMLDDIERIWRSCGWKGPRGLKRPDDVLPLSHTPE